MPRLNYVPIFSVHRKQIVDCICFIFFLLSVACLSMSSNPPLLAQSCPFSPFNKKKKKVIFFKHQQQSISKQFHFNC